MCCDFVRVLFNGQLTVFSDKSRRLGKHSRTLSQHGLGYTRGWAQVSEFSPTLPFLHKWFPPYPSFPLSKYQPALAQESGSSQPQSKGGIFTPLSEPSLDACFRSEIQFRKKKKKERPVSRAFREWSKPTSVLLSSYSLVLPLHSSNSHRLLLPFFPRFSSSPPLSCCSLTNSWAPHTLPPDSRASADCHRNQKKPAHRPKVALCSFSWSLTSEPFFRQPVTQQCEHRRNFRAALARLFHFQREMDELNHSAVLHRPNTTGKTCTHLCENASEPHSTRY